MPRSTPRDTPRVVANPRALRASRLAGPGLLVVSAFVVLLLGSTAPGAAAPLDGSAPGALARLGVPIATLVVELAAALTIGTLALASFALSPSRREWNRALDLASFAAALWTVAAGVAGFVAFLSAENRPGVVEQGFGQELATFVTGTGVGAAWLVTTIVAAVVTILCFAVRGVGPVLVVALVAAAGVIPIALQAHGTGAASSSAAVTALALHLGGTSVWLGGLVAIVVLRPSLGRGRTATVLARFSTLAVLCFVVVAVSTAGRALIVVGSGAEPEAGWGVLVGVEATALILLGVAGLMRRRLLLDGTRTTLATANPPFWWIVTAELALLGVVAGVSTALERTSAAATRAVAGTAALQTPAEILTGSPLPPNFTLVRWLTAWHPDLLWILVAVFLTVFYLGGARRVRARGESWPAWRTGAWLLGLAMLVFVTSGALNIYDRTLMSAHLAGVGLVGLVVPALLVVGAPFTLALFAIDKRDDGSRGPHEWLSVLAHSRVAEWLTFPVTGVLLLAGSLFAWVYSLPLLRWSVTTSAGHAVLVLQLVLVGWLFAQTLVGLDPVRLRAGVRVRVALLVAGAVTIVALGILLVTGEGLLLSNWFGALGRLWGEPPVADQQLGGTVITEIGLAACAGLGVGLALIARADRVRR